ncbi:DUF4136 domain-containing protein [Erythrobacter mangrovi]|uniref:DUF4136 domain-containing protein n=1 Tax=Erythrobacter mangrovi TaxID=2739433 RepID=A0A7D4BC10_9SPHN|nr:hypothetical protein [Erythrobacter mangrovi]QKG72366.1 hypothetical protein HQR01_13880 [Erythrobacter mangrovi]
MKASHALFGLAAALALSACATPTGPVEVTRFVAPERLSEVGRGTFFVEAMPGADSSTLELAPYKAAVAAELVRLGFIEADRGSARLIAHVGVQRGLIEAGKRRGPVNVGVGGSTGSYGSGVGLGIGINLGGGPKDRIGTELTVRIGEKDGDSSLWEGRADFRPPENSPLAQGAANAQTVASALFRDFPGNNGETIEVKVSE